MQHSDVQLVIARLLDIFHRRSPWQRRLWRLGVALSLDEALEYGAAVEEGGLREDGLKYVCDAAQREIQGDLGIKGDLRSQLVPALEAKALKTRQGRNILLHLIQRTRNDYLSTWRLAVGVHGLPGIEGTARALASHLLDSDLSPDHLHRWLTAVRATVEPGGPVALIVEAERVFSSPSREYEVLVPFIHLPVGADAHFLVLDGPTTRDWLERNKADASGVRYQSSLLVKVTAKDPWRAVEKVSDLVSRLEARATVGHSGTTELRASAAAFVEGKSDRFRLDQPRRLVEVHAVTRQNALFDVQPYGSSRLVDDALELVAALESGAPGAAISGGWAAIEGLLAEPGGLGSAAADRMASLVACSYPRAELTTLSYRHGQADDQLGQALKQAHSNRDRAKLVEQHLVEGKSLSLTEASDLAAERRMQLLIAQPKAVLARVRGYMAETFRRLYNQRNIVMHAGSLTSVAMHATLRTAPPLVGAGLDRLVHASLEADPVTPLALVARAEVELELVGTPAGRSLVDLLE